MHLMQHFARCFRGVVLVLRRDFPVISFNLTGRNAEVFAEEKIKREIVAFKANHVRRDPERFQHRERKRVVYRRSCAGLHPSS